jgi:phospholipid/cholesterol/gamma-HCH transport system ATP-binding protein
MIVAHVPPRYEGLPPLCDLAAGILAPAQGTVRFMGEEWCAAGPFKQSALRGRIGRVFGGHAWISNLSVAENVLLPQRHHTRRQESALVEEANGLARAFGLEEMPAVRPEDVRPRDLMRWQWVRAFMGDPRLLLLEEPEAGVWEEHRLLLREGTRRQAQNGCAVLWVTREDAAWRDAASPAVLHATVTDAKLICGSEAL